MYSDLYVLCESPEHLLGHFESLKEVFPARQVDGLVVRIVPVEVGDGLLQTKEKVHSAHDDVDSGGVASLCTQVVLESQVVSLAEELEETEEGDGQREVWEDLAQCCVCAWVGGVMLGKGSLWSHAHLQCGSSG